MLYFQLEKLKLFSATSADGSSLTLSAQDYIKELVPSAEEDEQEIVKTQSLQEDVKDILLEGET